MNQKATRNLIDAKFEKKKNLTDSISANFDFYKKKLQVKIAETLRVFCCYTQRTHIADCYLGENTTQMCSVTASCCTNVVTNVSASYLAIRHYISTEMSKLYQRDENVSIYRN
jgi:hypothetical protein